MPGTALRRLVGKVAVASLAVAAPVALTPVPASAEPPAELFLSEYIEGSSFNKAIEIYNGTGAAVDLGAGAYRLDLYSNGAASPSQTTLLTGVVASGDVFVAAHPSANAAILAAADVTSGSVVNWNGDDAIVLSKDGTVVDSFGRVGEDPGTGWGSGDTFTANHTLVRTATVCTGDTDPSDAFDPAVEWDGFAQDTVDGLGSHSVDCGPIPDQAPAVSSVSPEDGGTIQPTGTPTLTFSEPVALADGAVTLACSTSGEVSVTVTGGPTDYTVDPDADLVDGEECTLTVGFDGVTDVDADDPPDTMEGDFTSTFGVFDACAADYTPTYEIQGDGDSAAVTGQVLTRGVVTADYEGPLPNLRGFYLQDETGDGDPATSDGLFVFNGNDDSVDVGDIVVVTGDAGEFQDQTQVSDVSSIVVCGSGTVLPTEVSLPQPSEDWLERFEGMSVTFEQTLYVTEHFQLGRFAQVTVSSGDRLYQPTTLVAPGPEALALQAENDLDRLIIDDTLNNQNPDPIIWGRGDEPLSAENTLRGGDTTTGATGVMTYGWAGSSASPNNWRLRPVDQTGTGITFDAANPRPTDAPDVGGAVQVAGMNLLNYFNSFSGCTGGVGGPPLDCRGADNQFEFDRQRAKTVAAIEMLDADIIGVNEIENDGYGATSAIATLVDAVNDEVGDGTYSFIDADAGTGEVDALGDDAIKVGFLYKPAAVTPVGDTAVLDTEEFVNGGDSSPRNRPSLAQSWESTETGGIFTVDVNHLKSKGSECETPDLEDGQGNCSIVRTNAVRALLEWLAADPTNVDDSDVLLVGDYNSYAEEDPIRTLEAGGYTNLVEEYQGTYAYSYVFDGQWGYLDHALASRSMANQVTGAAEYHINADEPSVLDYNTNFKPEPQIESMYAPDEFRVSDHDPVLIGIDPAPSVYQPPYLTGPLKKADRSVRAGSTLPVKAVFELLDGSTPTDGTPFVEVRLRDEVVLSADMTYVDGCWQYNLRTRDLPETGVTYRVTAVAPENGQSVTTTFTLR